MNFEVMLHEDAAARLLRMDTSIRERMIKRIARMRDEPVGRHLKYGLDFFVIVVGQYRIVYTCEGKRKTIYFVGNHKEYEKWYSTRQH
jgi:mRNA-degrading endonuclease RelE of RelBE toxin-antitoxin system